MQQRNRTLLARVALGAFLALAVSLIGLAALTITAGPSSPDVGIVARPADGDGDAYPPAEVDRTARAVSYIDGVVRELVGRYLVDIAAEYVATVRAEEEAAAARRSASRVSNGGSSGGGGDCYSSDLPPHIVDAESGDPDQWNTEGSGAWGCFQIMPGTWNGTCSDLGSHGSASATAQTECANRLWDGGRGSSHWAATR